MTKNCVSKFTTATPSYLSLDNPEREIYHYCSIEPPQMVLTELLHQRKNIEIQCAVKPCFGCEEFCHQQEWNPANREKKIIIIQCCKQYENDKKLCFQIYFLQR